MWNFCVNFASRYNNLFVTSVKYVSSFYACKNATGLMSSHGKTSEANPRIHSDYESF